MVIQRARSLVVAEALLALALAQVGRAQQPQTAATEKPRQSTGAAVIIGTTTLRLGVPMDSAISALALQYDVRCEICGKDLRPAMATTYVIRGPNNATAGTLRFSAQGKLVAASKIWTPEERPYGEGEIGRILVALIGTLVSEGKRECSIDASEGHSVELKGQPPGPRTVFRDATIGCGDKLISLSVLTEADGVESLTITEEIGDPQEAFR